ncbi:hypothetical protein QWY77_06185 [Thalassotalea ponticola]|uniref:hypothetical protein n=1 Tax=Thalassotalea ponticola TaxID=1523392 RepID=UPI0025B5075D|nr:hypothetical protein [Thalassotalea ponticola]MDN3652349.1 hypothetical protein [Thalassotalea ponticola]
MLEKIILITVLTAFILVLAYVDKKYQLGLTDDTASTDHKKPSTHDTKQLQKRIEVLEKIVTEPSYELNQELEKMAKR